MQAFLPSETVSFSCRNRIKHGPSALDRGASPREFSAQSGASVSLPLTQPRGAPAWGAVLGAGAQGPGLGQPMGTLCSKEGRRGLESFGRGNEILDLV